MGPEAEVQAQVYAQVQVQIEAEAELQAGWSGLGLDELGSSWVWPGLAGPGWG